MLKKHKKQSKFKNKTSPSQSPKPHKTQINAFKTPKSLQNSSESIINNQIHKPTEPLLPKPLPTPYSTTPIITPLHLHTKSPFPYHNKIYKDRYKN